MTISVPLLMKSPAGWYIGTMCLDTKDDLWEPYQRLTTYFDTEDDARAFWKKENPYTELKRG